MPRHRLLRFHPLTLLASTALVAVVLLALVLTPQFFAREARVEVLRRHVDQVARLAASHLDGDLHRQLLNGGADAAALDSARVPLLRMHESWPEADYVYTMGVRDGRAHFVLDTAQDEEFASRRDLTASHYMEPFEQRPEYKDDWLQRLQSGEVYVTPGFQHDDYGHFLSGHAPILDSDGQVAGFVGVDFSLDYFLSEDRRFRRIEHASIACTLLLSLLIGYLYSQRRYALQAELRHHLRSSMQDPLTGLRNRRGALSAIGPMWDAPGATAHAALLVDVDHFKQINDTQGHRVGDDVLKALAAALRSSVRPGDVTARLGGDEFLIFARGCDRAGAEHIAQRLLAAVRAAQTTVPFTVSVGVAISKGLQGGYDLLYRNADAALYEAKNHGRDRIAMYEG